jgi:hypothetical protein
MRTVGRATQEEIDDAEVGDKQLNLVRDDFDNHAKEGESLMLEVQNMRTFRVATEVALDAVALMEVEIQHYKRRRL